MSIKKSPDDHWYYEFGSDKNEKPDTARSGVRRMLTQEELEQPADMPKHPVQGRRRKFFNLFS